MSDNEKVSVQNFSIYLIKDNRKDYEAILRGLDFSDEMTITDANNKIGHLFVKPTELGLPRWAKKFHGYIDESRIGKVATSSAVLIIKSESRYFAITFGQGRYLLDPDCWEERFGLRVALNSIGEKQIKSIDKKTFDTITKHSREQASREVGAQDFGLDVEQDLLRAVTGTPTDPSLGQRLGGMDGLKVTVRAEIKDLPTLVARYYEKYQDNSYKSNFPWVDHLMEVKDGNLVDLLDNLLVEIISRQEFNCCWLAAPEIMDWDQVDGFRYGLSQRSPICHDIHFPDFLESLHDNVEIDKKVLMKKNVYCVGDDNVLLYRWPIYKCINCEVDYSGDSYLLSGGKWYLVTRDFVQEINNAYALIPRFEDELPEFNHASEGDYNEHVVTTASDIFALMDKRTVQHGGSYNKIEFCDLYMKNGSLIHVKRYGASSTLSHLFAQGIVSGELFQTDMAFREKVNNLLPESHKLGDVKRHPAPGQYKVVFAVISDSDGDKLELPFFSRLNLRHAVRRLEGYGYKVAIAKIRVNNELKVLKRYT